MYGFDFFFFQFCSVVTFLMLVIICNCLGNLNSSVNFVDMKTLYRCDNRKVGSEQHRCVRVYGLFGGKKDNNEKGDDAPSKVSQVCLLLSWLILVNMNFDGLCTQCSCWLCHAFCITFMMNTTVLGLVIWWWRVCACFVYLFKFWFIDWTRYVLFSYLREKWIA